VASEADSIPARLMRIHLALDPGHQSPTRWYAAATLAQLDGYSRPRTRAEALTARYGTSYDHAIPETIEMVAELYGVAPRYLLASGTDPIGEESITATLDELQTVPAGVTTRAHWMNDHHCTVPQVGSDDDDVAKVTMLGRQYVRRDLVVDKYIAAFTILVVLGIETFILVNFALPVWLSVGLLVAIAASEFVKVNEASVSLRS